MKIKKYVANSMPEALKQIRKDLGPEAVIFNSREVSRGGFLGLFKKRGIEVIAALDEKNISSEVINEEKTSKAIQVIEKTPATQTVLNEIKQLKNMLAQHAFHSEHQFTPDYEYMFQYLLKQGIDHKLAEQFTHSLIDIFQNSADVTHEELVNALKQLIEEKLTPIDFQGITYDKKIIQLVGPTGVGKTTTIAKLAAHSMLVDHKKVAFITTDTYRIAAVEQLKTYARILNVPLEVVYSLKDYQQALKNFATYDLVLVDTAGRNFRNAEYVEEYKKLIQLNEEVETYLVMSLIAKDEDMQDIFDNFRSLKINKLIFTKLDETNTYGSMINLCLNHSVGIAYLTDGQDVPDDIIQPTQQTISELIVKEF